MANDEQANVLEFDVDAQCENCNAVSTITLFSLTGEALDACGTVCECGECQWIVRFSAHPDAAKMSKFERPD